MIKYKQWVSTNRITLVTHEMAGDDFMLSLSEKLNTLTLYIYLDTKYVHFVSMVCVFCSQSGSENPIVSDILNKP